MSQATVNYNENYVHCSYLDFECKNSAIRNVKKLKAFCKFPALADNNGLKNCWRIFLGETGPGGMCDDIAQLRFERHPSVLTDGQHSRRLDLIETLKHIWLDFRQ